MIERNDQRIRKVPRFQFGVVDLLLVAASIVVSICGGMMGGAAALQQSVAQLSDSNRQFFFGCGLVSGLLGSYVAYLVARSLCKKSFIRAIATLTFGFFVSITVVYYITSWNASI